MPDTPQSEREPPPSLNSLGKSSTVASLSERFEKMSPAQPPSLDSQLRSSTVGSLADYFDSLSPPPTEPNDLSEFSEGGHTKGVYEEFFMPIRRLSTAIRRSLGLGAKTQPRWQQRQQAVAAGPSASRPARWNWFGVGFILAAFGCIALTPVLRGLPLSLPVLTAPASLSDHLGAWWTSDGLASHLSRWWSGTPRTSAIGALVDAPLIGLLLADERAWAGLAMVSLGTALAVVSLVAWMVTSVLGTLAVLLGVRA
jgi:hypothetical protein